MNTITTITDQEIRDTMDDYAWDTTAGRIAGARAVLALAESRHAAKVAELEAQAAQPAQVAAPTQADGWQLVPVEATAPMLTALWNRRDTQSPAELGEAYRAMLAAAPKEPT